MFQISEMQLDYIKSMHLFNLYVVFEYTCVDLLVIGFIKYLVCIKCIINYILPMYLLLIKLAFYFLYQACFIGKLLN